MADLTNLEVDFYSLLTLKEHHQLLTKMDISLISDKGLNGTASTGDLTKYLLQ